MHKYALVLIDITYLEASYLAIDERLAVRM